MNRIGDIERNIVEYGYLLVRPKKIVPSYYRLLDDGSIIEALIRVESIVQDIHQQTGYSVRTSNNTKVYIPKEKRKPEEFKQIQPNDLISGVIDEDVQVEELISDNSEYELSNGTLLFVRTIVNQIRKTKYYSVDGEPIYSVVMTPIIKFREKK